MTDQAEKRPPGRPPTGKARKVAVTIQVAPSTLAWIDAECRRRGVARGVVVDWMAEQVNAMEDDMTKYTWVIVQHGTDPETGAWLCSWMIRGSRDRDANLTGPHGQIIFEGTEEDAKAEFVRLCESGTAIADGLAPQVARQASRDFLIRSLS